MISKLLGLAAAALVLTAPSMAQEAQKPEGHHMEQFMVVEKHTPKDCLKMLDAVETKGGMGLLDKFEWGCKSGDHTGYALVDASSEAAVREMLPASMKDVRIIKVTRFTPAEVKSLHEKKG